MKLNAKLIMGAVGQVNAASRIGHRGEGVVDLLPLMGVFAAVMHGIGKGYRLMQAAAKVENPAGASTFLYVANNYPFLSAAWFWTVRDDADGRHGSCSSFSISQ